MNFREEFNLSIRARCAVLYVPPGRRNASFR